MNSLIIACNTIKDELNIALNSTDCKYPVLWIDSGLHMYPDSLRKRLQDEIDHISNVDHILLAFGFCGNSLIGITATNCSIVLPCVDDCITFLLGSCEKRKEISNEMGTYFLTKGWLDYENNIWEEYQYTVKRMGKEKADRVYKIMLQHYKRLGVIDTGAYNLEEFLKESQLVAKDLKLTHEVIKGNLSYVEKLLTGPWDDDFVVINPGESISLAHIKHLSLSQVNSL